MAATKVVATAILAIYAIQIGLGSAGMLELAAAIVGDVVVLAGLYIYVRANELPLGVLGLVRAPAIYNLAAVLIGLAAWYVNFRIVVWLEPPGDSSGLTTSVTQTALLPTFVALAVLPPIAEELVFRGVFVRALATRLSATAAVGLSALVFALYHLLPAQMISTFLLGLALGYLTLRARSVVPAMIAHLLNNAIAVLVSRDEVPGLSPWMGAHATVMLVGSSLLVAAGLALTAKGPA